MSQFTGACPSVVMPLELLPQSSPVPETLQNFDKSSSLPLRLLRIDSGRHLNHQHA